MPFEILEMHFDGAGSQNLLGRGVLSEVCSQMLTLLSLSLFLLFLSLFLCLSLPHSYSLTLTLAPRSTDDEHNASKFRHCVGHGQLGEHFNNTPLPRHWLQQDGVAHSKHVKGAEHEQDHHCNDPSTSLLHVGVA